VRPADSARPQVGGLALDHHRRAGPSWVAPFRPKTKCIERARRPQTWDWGRPSGPRRKINDLAGNWLGVLRAAVRSFRLAQLAQLGQTVATTWTIDGACKFKIEPRRAGKKGRPLLRLGCFGAPLARD